MLLSYHRIRAIGSSIRLKQKFGAGYQVSISVLPPGGSQLNLADMAAKADVVKAAFRQVLQLEPFDESKAYIQVRASDNPVSDRSGCFLQLQGSGRERK